MCTVSFIPVKNRMFITSNRDEQLMRRRAVPPQQYQLDAVRLVFPRDGEAGGTWIALRENGDAAVLLNGGFQKHRPEPPYKRSRGLVFIEIMKEQMHIDHFMHMSLDGIEPFTIIIVENKRLYECRWDGAGKHCKELSTSSAYIWSSVTLYNETIIEKRESWFREWLEANPDPVQEDILHFHLFGGVGDKHNDFRMNRNDQLLTVSVTGIEMTNETARMKYLDLSDDSVHETAISFIPSYAF